MVELKELSIIIGSIALDQYLIVVLEISSITVKFYTFFGMTDSEDQEHHYELKGGKNKGLQIM